MAGLFLNPHFLRGQDQDFDVPPDHQLGDTLLVNADLFAEGDPIQLTLTFDLKSYKRNKYADEYIPVHLKLVVPEGAEVEKEVRIKPRGEFRRKHCSLAPFWLNIRKSDVANVHLQDVKRMKMVTQCFDGKSYENYVMREYLAYKIYNLITPASFRVRLIQIRYVDTGRKMKETPGWAFLIEPESMMAQRNQATVVKNDKLGMVHMRQDEMLRVAVFMYLIGNGDYSVSGRHNLKLMGVGKFGTEGFTPVPYDFDYAGIVNAHYAVPGESLGIESVKERYYLGPCASEESYQKAIRIYTEKRDEILGLVRDFPYLGEKDRKEVVRYLESFFEKSSQAAFICQHLEPTCR
jgi:hypothetical protein